MLYALPLIVPSKPLILSLKLIVSSKLTVSLQKLTVPFKYDSLRADFAYTRETDPLSVVLIELVLPPVLFRLEAQQTRKIFVCRLLG